MKVIQEIVKERLAREEQRQKKLDKVKVVVDNTFEKLRETEQYIQELLNGNSLGLTTRLIESNEESYQSIRISMGETELWFYHLKKLLPISKKEDLNYHRLAGDAGKVSIFLIQKDYRTDTAYVIPIGEMYIMLDGSYSGRVIQPIGNFGPNDASGIESIIQCAVKELLGSDQKYSWAEDQAQEVKPIDRLDEFDPETIQKGIL